MRKAIFTALFLLGGATVASADPIEGLWQTQPDEGAFAHVQIAPCGGAFCGTIVRTFKGNSEYQSPNVGRQIVIDMAPKGQMNGTTRLSGTIRDITYFGSMRKYMVAVEGRQPIEVDVDAWRNPHELREGQAVDLGWADHAAVRLDES